MAFADTIKTIPGHAKTGEAKGFLPPYMRMMGHMLHLLADAASETPVITVDEAQTEIGHASSHWEALTGDEILSTAARDHVKSIGKALEEAIAEWPEWDGPTRTRNMRDLVNRAVGLAVPLDRELLGIPDSDAGFNL